MIKSREARYCNIKILLIFLVIYGHLIELQIHQNTIVSMQYKFIYLFHMPTFAFLSGLFVKDCQFCRMQLKKTILLYAGLQVLIFICSGGAIDLRYPYWILWYLLSLSCWLCFTLVWLSLFNESNKISILIISIIIGCLVGCVNFIDRIFSLSRTLVFFPYFWLGIMLDYKTEWQKYRFIGMISLLCSILILIFTNDHITVNFLYHATPYGTIQNGAILRFICYVIGMSLIVFLLTWMPDKRFIFTKAGTNTLPAYILHAVFVILLRELYLSWYVYLVLTGIFLWILYRITQIEGMLYTITLSDRRKNNVHFPKNI